MQEPRDMNAEILAVVRPSPPRRAFALVVLFGLGGFLAYLAFAYPPASMLWQAFLLGAAVIALWTAMRLHSATALSLVLTRQALSDSDDRVLARIDAVKSLDRGTFAFKPSNGFTLKLEGEAAFAWAPGLWWRIGRRLGVGGVTPAAQTKAMAEAIAMLIAERETET